MEKSKEEKVILHKNFLYSVSIGDPECGTEIILLHPKKFTHEELLDIVAEAARSVFPRIVKAGQEQFDYLEGKSAERPQDWICFNEEGLSFEELFPYIIGELERGGFKEINIKIDAAVSLQGMDSVCLKGSWEGNEFPPADYEEENTVRGRIPDDLKRECLKFAEKILDIRFKKYKDKEEVQNG